MESLISQHKLESFAKFGHKLDPSCYYVAGRHKALLTCPNGHQFSVTWDQWNQGSRCPVCREQKQLPCRVYYLKFNFHYETRKGIEYKIGITTKTVTSRWKECIDELVQTAVCKDEPTARKVESRIKRRFKSFTKKNSTEFFSKDVLDGRLISDFADTGDIIPESEAIVPVWSSFFSIPEYSRARGGRFERLFS